jgi:hypothetical protein
MFIESPTFIGIDSKLPDVEAESRIGGRVPRSRAPGLLWPSRSQRDERCATCSFHATQPPPLPDAAALTGPWFSMLLVAAVSPTTAHARDRERAKPR